MIKHFSFALYCLLVSQLQAYTSYDSIGVEQKNGAWFIVHAVEKGETLYALAKRYHSTVPVIQEQNQHTNILSIGQILYIPHPSLPFDSLRLISSPSIAPLLKPSLAMPRPTTDSPWPSDSLFTQAYAFKQIEEEGMASQLKGKKGLYALHNKAPLGTFVKIENLINKERLLARVIGRIPAIDIHKKTLVQLSPEAYTLLQSPDTRTRVRLSYLFPIQKAF